ncbi:MAG: 30S ribosomal protein S13 [Thermoplasmata archaeon]
MRSAPKNPKEEVAAPAAAAPSSEPPTSEKSSKKDKPSKGRDGGKEKDGKSKSKKSGPGEGKPQKPVSDNPNFRYIVRVANTDLDGRRRTGLALTGVRGVGLRIAEATCQMTGVDAHALIGDLPEPTVDQLEATLNDLSKRIPPWMINVPRDYISGELYHHIGPELETSRRDSINQMKMIRSYRGVRHERGQKVRGQRTRSNGRTGMAAGVLKKAAKEAAQGKAREESAPAATPSATPATGGTKAPPAAGKAAAPATAKPAAPAAKAAAPTAKKGT